MSRKSGGRLHTLVLGLLLFVCGLRVQAGEFTIHAAPLGAYMIKIGPTLDESTGMMMEIANAALKRAGLSAKVAPVVPWARVQAEAIDEPGSIIVLYARTPLREKRWRWLALMYTDKLLAITMKGQPAYASYEEIRARRPRVGAKLGGASESNMKSLGVPVDVSPDTDKNLMKLIAGRIDVLLIQRMEAYPTVQEMLTGRYREEFAPRVPDLQRTQIGELPLWFVTSLKTSPEDVRRLKQAFNDFRRTPEYHALVRKYESRVSAMNPQ